MAEDTISKRIEVYKNELYPMPSSEINPKRKLEPAYGIKICQAILSSYLGDKCAIPYGMLDRYDRIRRYSDGDQDAAQYLTRLGLNDHQNKPEIPNAIDGISGLNKRGKDNKEYKNKGYGNLNTQIISPAPKIKQGIHGAFDEADFNVLADTIDPDSQFEQEVKKSEIFAKSQHLGAFNHFNQQMGLPAESDSQYPKDIDELELLDAIGEFKTPIAKAIQKCCKHTYDISDWYNTKRKLIDDIINFNACALRDYYDQEDKKYKTRYVDVTRVIAQYSDHRDYSDSSFFGELRQLSLGEIRHKLEEAGYSEDDIKACAQLWCGSYMGISNPGLTYWEKYNQMDNYGNWLYNFFKCMVLEVEWLENDTFYNIESTNFGRRKVFDQKEWGKVVNGTKSKTVTTTIKRKYEAKWIIGTNMIYDLKISPSQPRKQSNKRPLFSYHVFSGEEMSITQRLIPVYDEFMLIYLKYQNECMKLHNEVMMLDVSVLEKIVKPGDINSLIETIRLMAKEGILPFRSLGISGKYPGGNVKPAERLPSTMMERINEYDAGLRLCIQQINILTGINLMQTDPNKPVQTAEMDAQNTATILKPIINSIFSLKEDSAEFLSEAIRLAVRNDPESYKAYAMVIGENDTQALKQSNYEARQLGIKLIPKPTGQQIEHLYQSIEQASQPGKDGKPLIGFEVKMYVEEKLMHEADLTDIRLYVSNAVKKERERQDKMQQQVIQQQGQNNQQLKQTEVQGDIAREQEKIKGAIALEKEKGNQARLTNEAKYNHEKYIQSNEIQAKQMELNFNQQQNAGNQGQSEPTIAGR
jgi:hypothetical protein